MGRSSISRFSRRRDQGRSLRPAEAFDFDYLVTHLVHDSQLDAGFIGDLVQKIAREGDYTQ